jgi:hypothetical protein
MKMDEGRRLAGMIEKDEGIMKMDEGRRLAGMIKKGEGMMKMDGRRKKISRDDKEG